MAEPSGQNIINTITTGLSGPAVHVSDRFANSHRKASSPGPSAHETHRVGTNWRVPESLEKVIPVPRTLHPHLQWCLKEDNVLTGQPLHPIKHALQIFTDASKEGWGAHLNEHTARGSWSLPESKLHINYLELKAVFLALKEFQDLCTDKIVLVATKRGSRQSILIRPDHPNRVVSPSRDLPSNMQQVAPASNRPICHEVQQQVASVCLTGTRSPGHSSGCTQPAMGGSGHICLPSCSHLGQSGGEVAGLPMQENHSDCSGVAQDALILGPSHHDQSDPTEPAFLVQPVDTALQSDPS